MPMLPHAIMCVTHCNPTSSYARPGNNLIGYAGALLTGSSHWAASAKVLREEGVDPKLRLQALPVAVGLAGKHFTDHNAAIDICSL